MKTNAEQFIASFVSIEMYLKSYLKNQGTGFANRVAMAAKKHPVIKKHQSFLIEVGQLRNAIVHSRVGDTDEIIAEPHDRIVADLKRLENVLIVPKKALEFCKSTVYSVQKSDPIVSVLKKQKQHNYSVVPAYDQKRYLGVLHPRLYQRFLEENIETVINLKQLKVSDLLTYHRDDERIVFVDAKQTIDEILSIYERLYDKGRVLIAIIITINGYQDEHPLGILTPIDFANIFAELE